MNDQVKAPMPPKGIGISRRLLFTMGGVIVLMILLFLLFLNHSTHQTITSAKTSADVVTDSDSAASLIQKLQREPNKLLLAPATRAKQNEKNTDSTVSEETTHSQLLSDNDFKQGSDAEISVYQNTTTANASSTASYTTDSRNNTTFGMAAPNKAMDNYSVQNGQSEKVAFLQSSQSTEKDTIQSKLKNPLSPYEIKAGTIIPASLMTGINSDLPGTIIAKVSRDVFDTVTGNYLLIPQGSTLMGVYDSQIAYGQSRILIAWSRLIFPNGNSFDLEGQPGIDLAGMAGLHDLVNNHYFRIFGSALLFSAFGAGGQLSQPQTASDQLTTQQIIYAAIGQQMSQTGAQLIEKNMNIQPTIEIRLGTNFNVLLTRDMVLPSSYQF